MATASTGLPEHHVAHHFDSAEQEFDSVKTGKETSRVRTRFQSVPDAPVSKFVLKLKGGSRGLIENSQDLCQVKPVATVQVEGQNGKRHDFQQKMATVCGKGRKGK